MRQERSGVGVTLALLSAVTFATSGSFARSLVTAGWSAPAAVVARTSVAAMVLAAPAAWSLRGRWHLLRRGAGTIGLYGVFAVGIAQLCFFSAVQRVPVGIALLLEYLGIVLVVGWMWARHGQRPRRLTLAGSVGALLGLVLVLDITGAAHLDLVGVLWGLGATVGLATYFVLSAHADTGLPPVVLASGALAVGAIALLLLSLTGILPLHTEFGAVDLGGHRLAWWVPVAGLSLVAAVVPYVTGIGAARILGARLSSFLGLTEVMFGVLIAWLVLGELPTTRQLVGGILIIAGVVLVRVDELRQPVVERGETVAPEAVLIRGSGRAGRSSY